MREESKPLPPLLQIAPLLRFPAFPHPLPSFLLSRIPAAMIVYDNPSTPIFPPQQTKQ